MHEQQQNIDDIFRQSLGDYREVPPAGIWDEVAARLDDEDNRRRGYFQRWPWIMMVLLLLIGGAWLVMTLHGRGAGTDHGREDAAGLANTQTEIHQTSELSQLPASDGNELPGNEANPVIAETPSEPAEKAPARVVANTETTPKTEKPGITPASGNNSTGNRQASDAQSAQTTVIAAAGPQSSGKPANTTRRKTSVTAPVLDNTLTATSSTTTDSAAIATATIYSNKNSYKKTTVYGKVVVVEELPGKSFERNLIAPAKTSIGTSDATTRAAQNKTTPSEQEFFAKESIASATPKTRQSVSISQKATVAQKDKSRKQTNPATPPAAIPLNKSALSAAGKPTADSGKSGQANNKQTVKAVAATIPATGTLSPATSKKQTQKAKQETALKATTVTTATTKAQKKTTPTAQDHPAKATVASAPSKTRQSVPAPQKAVIAQKDTSLKQAKTEAALVNNGAHAGNGKPTADSGKSGQVSNKRPTQTITVAAAIPAKVPLPGANAKKQTQKVIRETASVATAVGTATTVKNTSSLTPLAEKKHTLATKELFSPTLLAAPAMPAAQPKTQKAEAATAKVQPPTPTSADTLGSAKPTDSTTAVARPKYPMSLSVAALGGYELGMQSPAPGRIAAGARILLHLSPRASIGLQPTIRYGTVASQKVTDEKTYQRSVINVDNFTSLAVSPSIRNAIDTLHHYVIRETFDSIIVGSTTTGGKSLEFELPLIINYKLSNTWHVYGGPSLNFGGKLTVTDPSIQTYTVHRKDSLVQSVPIPSSEFVNYFGKSSLEPYSNYQASAAVLQDPVSVRLGYILGVGYDWKRIIFDASLHQQVSGYEAVAPPLQKVYSSPYLRMSLGYLLFPTKKSQKNTMK